MTRLPSRQLLTLTLLLPVVAWAETPWDCTRQPDGQWVCNSKPPPPQTELPATDSREEATPDTGEPPAAALEGEASAVDSKPDLPVTGAGAAATPATEPAATTMDQAATHPRSVV